MNEEEINEILEKLKELEIKERLKLKEILRPYTTLYEEADYWIREKEIRLTKDEKERVIEELVSRWDRLADEELEEIVEEIKE